MLTELKDKKEFSRIQTLCDRCSRATGSGCLFFHLEDPDEGLRLVGAEAAWIKTRDSRAYKVVRCREFEAGRLPAIGG